MTLKHYLRFHLPVLALFFLTSLHAANGSGEAPKNWGASNPPDKNLSSPGGAMSEAGNTVAANAFIDKLVKFSKMGERTDVRLFDLSTVEADLGIRLVELPSNAYSSARRFIGEGEDFSSDSQRENVLLTLERREVKNPSLSAVYKVAIDLKRHCINFDSLLSHTSSTYYRRSNTPVPSSGAGLPNSGGSRDLAPGSKGGVFYVGKGFFLVVYVMDDGCVQQIEAFSSFKDKK